MRNKKKMVGIIVIVIIAVIAVVGALYIFKFIKEKNALKLVQNGYMGEYNTVTTKEVMEDFPKDEGSQKWDVITRQINGEKRILVKFVYNDNVVIEFLPAKDGKTYKVYYMESDGEKIDADEFSNRIDAMYINYMQRHPEKGVNSVNNKGEFDKGREGKIEKVSEGPLYDNDMKDYIDKLCFKSTVERLDLRAVEINDLMGEKVAYESKEGNLYIMLEDENISESDDNIVTVNMIIEGSRNMSPSFYGSRLGDDCESVKEKLNSQGFELMDDKQIDRRINDLVFSNNNSTVSIRYRTNTNRIYTIFYEKEIKVSELKKFGYMPVEFIESDSKVEIPENKEVESGVNAQEDFIGLEGVYVCISDPESSDPGKIEIYTDPNGDYDILIGTLNGTNESISARGQSINGNTVQCNTNNCTFTFIWNDGENMVITRTGGDTGIDSIDNSTDNQVYFRAAEFNQ